MELIILILCIMRKIRLLLTNKGRYFDETRFFYTIRPSYLNINDKSYKKNNNTEILHVVIIFRGIMVKYELWKCLLQNANQELFNGFIYVTQAHYQKQKQKNREEMVWNLFVFLPKCPK